jgi:hypothetical protein
MRAAILAAMALLTVLPAAAQEEDAQRIRFETGKSSAEIRGTLAVRDGEMETDAYLLRASAGQTMTVRFASPEPEAAYAVVCPGQGSTEAGASPWTFELPESGDYRITVSGPYEAKKDISYILDVAVEGKPHPVEPRGLTGTYGLVEDPDSTIEVVHLPDGRLRFHLLALWKGANWKEYGPNIGEAQGTVKLEKNRAVYREEGCLLAMTFKGDTLKIDQEGDCGFGHNVYAGGTYRRTSLCSAPEAGEE